MSIWTRLYRGVRCFFALARLAIIGRYDLPPPQGEKVS